MKIFLFILMLGLNPSIILHKKWGEISDELNALFNQMNERYGLQFEIRVN